MNFNQSQILAMNHFTGPCCVLAGPGSGKTAVITHRIKNLITEHQVEPSQILVITFTKAAAEGMKHRFLGLMQETEKTKPAFGTFHAIFFHILKNTYGMDVTNILTEPQKYQVMREIIAQQKLDYKDEKEIIDHLLSEISTVKNERIPLEYFYSSHCGEDIFRTIYSKYENYLRRNKKIDFDDMLVHTYELFLRKKDVLEAWQKKYPFILIDEFQDINLLQYKIIQMLALPFNNLFIVGDDDQSIYRFRGSKPEIMLGFKKDYPEAKEILLDVNYRCDANVVQAASHLIAHNTIRFEKKIQAFREAKYPVNYRFFQERDEECRYIVEKLQREAKGNWSAYAVLFRTNRQPRQLMELMLAHGIPFRVREQMSNPYEHWIARDLFAYLRIAQGSRRRADFLQVMNRPNRYLSRDSLEYETVSFEDWKDYYWKQDWIKQRIEDLEEHICFLAKLGPYAAVNYIRKGMGYEDYLKEYAQKHGMELEELTEILDEIHLSSKGVGSMDAWQKKIEAYKEELKRLAREKNNDEPAVLLATLHSCKGLEFPYVMIVDANEGVMPYKKAVLLQEVEEERRMFYVGMTRAQKELTICSVKSKEVSRFVREAQGQD